MRLERVVELQFCNLSRYPVTNSDCLCEVFFNRLKYKENIISIFGVMPALRIVCGCFDVLGNMPLPGFSNSRHGVFRARSIWMDDAEADFGYCVALFLRGFSD